MSLLLGHTVKVTEKLFLPADKLLFKIGKPRKKFFFSGPVTKMGEEKGLATKMGGGEKARPLRNFFLKLEKKSEKNVAT